MTLDELIERLQNFKDHGVSGDAEVKKDYTHGVEITDVVSVYREERTKNYKLILRSHEVFL